MSRQCVDFRPCWQHSKFSHSRPRLLEKPSNTQQFCCYHAFCRRCNWLLKVCCLHTLPSYRFPSRIFYELFTPSLPITATMDQRVHSLGIFLCVVKRSTCTSPLANGGCMPVLSVLSPGPPLNLTCHCRCSFQAGPQGLKFAPATGVICWVRMEDVRDLAYEQNGYI